MYYKPIPIPGKKYKFSNKKFGNSRSGQICTVLIVSPADAAVHNCLIEFEDGFQMVTSKWNLFDIEPRSIPAEAILEFKKSGFSIKNSKFIFSGNVTQA